MIVLDNILAKINKQQIASIYLLQTTENYIEQEVLRKMKDEATITELNEIIFDLEEQPLVDVIQEVNEISFFSETRLVVVKNPYFLTSERKKNDFDNNIEDLIAYIENPNKDVIFVLLASYEKLDERKKITKLLKKHAIFLQYIPKNQNTKQYLQQYLPNNQIEISSDAKDELLYLTDGKLSTTMQEIKKLELYADGQLITKEMVNSLVSKQLEHVIFDLVDYLLKGQKQQALEMYQDMIAEGEDAIKINYILLMQLRLMIQIKLLQQRNYTAQDIANSLKIHPYRVKKTGAQITRTTLSKLAHFFDVLVDFEEILKSSVSDEVSLFQIITARLKM